MAREPSLAKRGKLTDQEYILLKERVLKLTGIDLQHYKSQQMRRRLDGYLARARFPGVIPFCNELERNLEATRKLRDFLTINVSEFFRDAEQYQTLKSRILPDLLKRNPNLRVWSAGCSIGAEPYSIAMLLAQIAPKGGHRILATDLDVGALAKARAGGPYAAAEIKNVDRGLLLKYFVRDQETYRVRDEMKRLVEFKQHNLLDDPYEKGFDLVICRNVIIYFTDDAKQRVHRLLYGSLKENGVYFSGSTETLLNARELGLTRVSSSFYKKSVSLAPLVAEPRRNRVSEAKAA